MWKEVLVFQPLVKPLSAQQSKLLLFFFFYPFWPLVLIYVLRLHIFKISFQISVRQQRHGKSPHLIELCN